MRVRLKHALRKYARGESGKKGVKGRGFIRVTAPPTLPERDVEREGQDRVEEEGHRVARGRWAPPPMEAKGPREGQQMAIGQ